MIHVKRMAAGLLLASLYLGFAYIAWLLIGPIENDRRHIREFFAFLCPISAYLIYVGGAMLLESP